MAIRKKQQDGYFGLRRFEVLGASEGQLSINLDSGFKWRRTLPDQLKSNWRRITLALAVSQADYNHVSIQPVRYRTVLTS